MVYICQIWGLVSSRCVSLQVTQQAYSFSPLQSKLVYKRRSLDEQFFRITLAPNVIVVTIIIIISSWSLRATKNVRNGSLGRSMTGCN